MSSFRSTNLDKADILSSLKNYLISTYDIIATARLRAGKA
jgi:hypothetical protein